MSEGWTEEETTEKGQAVIDTNEKFMREASKQMVENLTEIKNHLRVIRSWVVFFGVMAVLGAILGGCNLLLSF